jgi:hypothetical protein
LHPAGAGPGLAAALVATVVASAVFAAVATAHLAIRVGAPAWFGGLIPLVPGVWWSVRLTLADALALALMLAALSASLAGRHRRAVIAAVAAVLAKEVVVLAFAGLWLWRRDRGRSAVVLAPLALGLAWAIALRMWMGRLDGNARELTLPFAGILEASSLWITYVEPLAPLSVIGTLILAVTACVYRRWNWPTRAGSRRRGCAGCVPERRV